MVPPSPAETKQALQKASSYPRIWETEIQAIGLQILPVWQIRIMHFSSFWSHSINWAIGIREWRRIRELVDRCEDLCGPGDEGNSIVTISEMLKFSGFMYIWLCYIKRPIFGSDHMGEMEIDLVPWAKREPKKFPRSTWLTHYQSPSSGPLPSFIQEVEVIKIPHLLRTVALNADTRPVSLFYWWRVRLGSRSGPRSTHRDTDNSKNNDNLC